MTGLNTPLAGLSNEVSGIRFELTNLQLGVVQLGRSLGTLHGQIGGDNPDVNTNLPVTGLVGRLVRTEVALESNTVAIAQVNASLTTNNHLLGESTKALKGVDRLEKLLPLLAAMLALMGTFWTAINLGNDARKNAWDKLQGVTTADLDVPKNDFAAGIPTNDNTRKIESAIMSVSDFRDAYAYSMFQLLVAGLITAAFFWEIIIADFSLLLTLPFLFSAGFASLVVLYTGDQRDVQLMFNGRWPLKKPCPIYWFCPLFDNSNESPNLVCKLAKTLFFLIAVSFIVGMIVLLTLRVSEKLKADNAFASMIALVGNGNISNTRCSRAVF